MVTLSGRGDKDVDIILEQPQVASKLGKNSRVGFVLKKSSIDSAFEVARKEGRRALIGYMTAGYPSPKHTIRSVQGAH